MQDRCADPHPKSAFRKMGLTQTARAALHIISGYISLMTGAIEEAQRRLTVGTAVDSQAAVVATAGVSIEVRTGWPTAYLPVGCEIPSGEGNGSRTRREYIFHG